MFIYLFHKLFHPIGAVLQIRALQAHFKAQIDLKLTPVKEREREI